VSKIEKKKHIFSFENSKKKMQDPWHKNILKNAFCV